MRLFAMRHWSRREFCLRLSATLATSAPGGAAERQRILDALDKCGGNQKEAAKVLGISRRTLEYRLDAHGVPRPRKRT